LGVETGRTATGVGDLAFEPGGEQRQGAAHQNSGQQKQADGERAFQQQQRGGVFRDMGADADEDCVGKFVNVLEEEGVNADGQFDVAVGGERLLEEGGALAEKAIAEGEAAHENGEDDGLRLDGAAEHEGEVFGPEDFVNERRRAGDEEQQ
jgi:hypothetical protein